jgi:hypothetical protein
MSGVDEGVLVRGDHELRAVVRVQLGHDPADVRLGGVRGDHQVGGDLVVGPPASDQGQHLDLALGQVRQRGGGVLRRRGGLHVAVDQRARGGR